VLEEGNGFAGLAASHKTPLSCASGGPRDRAACAASGVGQDRGFPPAKSVRMREVSNLAGTASLTAWHCSSLSCRLSRPTLQDASLWVFSGMIGEVSVTHRVHHMAEGLRGVQRRQIIRL
jgi:hypothetical protein